MTTAESPVSDMDVFLHVRMLIVGGGRKNKMTENRVLCSFLNPKGSVLAVLYCYCDEIDWAGEI